MSEAMKATSFNLDMTIRQLIYRIAANSIGVGKPILKHGKKKTKSKKISGNVVRLKDYR